MDLIDSITKGRKQGSIVHAPRIRPIAPISVLSPPVAENHLSLCPTRWL
jgi:hypothetical protein